MIRTFISELAQRLGKSEEEVVQFFQILWQVVPPSPETQPFFFRYLDERFLRLEDRVSNFRHEMLSQNEDLRKEMQQGDAALMQQIESLRKEMQKQNEDLRKEMQHNNALLKQEIEALRHHVERVEKWLFALTIPVLVSTLGILVMLLKP
ncbi:MAG: hypothetical protein NZ805_12490 [Armatimonadetes bacterium]|nr:hypothetical protein [Armatimonadota bacterium]